MDNSSKQPDEPRPVLSYEEKPEPLPRPPLRAAWIAKMVALFGIPFWIFVWLAQADFDRPPNSRMIWGLGFLGLIGAILFCYSRKDADE